MLADEDEVTLCPLVTNKTTENAYRECGEPMTGLERFDVSTHSDPVLTSC